MQQTEEFAEVEFLTKEQVQELLAKTHKNRPLSQHQRKIEEAKDLLMNAPEEGGLFIPAEYKSRANLRRRILKAANQIDYVVEFTPNYRGGELVRVISRGSETED